MARAVWGQKAGCAAGRVAGQQAGKGLPAYIAGASHLEDLKSNTVKVLPWRQFLNRGKEEALTSSHS